MVATAMMRHSSRRPVLRRTAQRIHVGADDQVEDNWLPKPTILDPWPSDRLAVTHPRSPDALDGLPTAVALAVRDLGGRPSSRRKIAEAPLNLELLPKLSALP